MKTIAIIAMRSARLGPRMFAAGEVGDCPADQVPENFVPLKVQGPNGVVRREFFFALRNTVIGHAFQVGDLFDQPNAPCPEAFAPLADRKLYTLKDEGNGTMGFHLKSEVARA